MNPNTAHTLCQIGIAVFSILTILCTYGNYHFGRQSQALKDKVSTQIQEKVLENQQTTNSKLGKLLEKMQHVSETDHEKLMQEYPLGYILFAIKDKHEIIGKQSQQEWEIDWNSARILALDEKQILFSLPNMRSNDGERKFGTNTVTISREKGIALVIKAFGVEIFSGVLVDDSSGIVCIIGLKEYK
ncbi:MAG TPA: hypothetical protein HPP66_09675 [Planctomycetes bacterium]|nr:hypothetical protein [Planctomycetota bacterium]